MKKPLNNPFRCDHCGQFVSYEDLDAGRAVHSMLTPDSHLSTEEWETYHVACKEQRRKELEEQQYKARVQAECAGKLWNAISEATNH